MGTVQDVRFRTCESANGAGEESEVDGRYWRRLVVGGCIHAATVFMLNRDMEVQSTSVFEA